MLLEVCSADYDVLNMYIYTYAMQYNRTNIAYDVTDSVTFDVHQMVRQTATHNDVTILTI